MISEAANIRKIIYQSVGEYVSTYRQRNLPAAKVGNTARLFRDLHIRGDDLDEVYLNICDRIRFCPLINRPNLPGEFLPFWAGIAWDTPWLRKRIAFLQRKFDEIDDLTVAELEGYFTLRTLPSNCKTTCGATHD